MANCHGVAGDKLVLAKLAGLLVPSDLYFTTLPFN
jgi:hypothetical protein